jgi:hypothetical protein
MTLTITPSTDKDAARFIVKVNDNGKKVGVYDTVDGCYHAAGPLLRAVGIDYLPWFTEGSVEKRVTEAQAVADLLNERHGNGVTKATVSKGKGRGTATQSDDEAAFRAAAEAIIADEKKGRA